ncbi:MAG: shikimate dehydrogenase [Thermodesulfobacteriota bacterium]
MGEKDVEVFALFGDPVAHSLSPVMHNFAFEEMGLTARYVPFRVVDLGAAIQGVRGLNIKGVSITIPFKTEVLGHLDEVDGGARRIGAVNTIVNRGGRLWGFNTDWIGLVTELRQWMEIKGKTFAILGAGGAARAAIFGVMSHGGIPLVLSRRAEKGKRVASEFGCRTLPLSEIHEVEADCLINATPVGMVPDAELSPLHGVDLARFHLVMDVIYNPFKTRLLKDAERAGCLVVPGVGMFVHQGAEQIRLWTGMEPPRDRMRDTVLKRLQADHGD